jgi:xanthine dehydrogenase accessory factor
MTVTVLGSPTDLNSATRARAADLRARRVPFVMATVVRAERPTSAKAGDVAVVLADGTVEGFVGGECAEASVQHRALEALDTGQPVLLRISPGASPDAGATPGSPGEPAGGAALTQGLVTVHNPCLSGGTLEIFLEPDLPPALLVVHGDSPIAMALASLGEHLGYEVAHTGSGSGDAGDAAGGRGGSAGGGAGDAAGGRGGSAGGGGEMTGAAAVVVASHGRGEEAILTAAVEANVPYIGLVASRTRGAAVLDRLDLPEDAKSRIHTPAGLDLGARKPQEIALSILAEIVSTRPRGAGQRAADSGAGEPEHPAEPTAPAPALPTATDPVCGMTVAVTSSALVAEDGAAQYYFCGQGCRDAFIADPSGYVALR